MGDEGEIDDEANDDGEGHDFFQHIFGSMLPHNVAWPRAAAADLWGSRLWRRSGRVGQELGT